MLKIKLIRFGKKNQPHYRVVVQEARTKRDGKYTAKLGHYAPTQEPKLLNIDLDQYQEWLQKGAQPTKTVALLVERLKSGNPFPKKKKKPSKKQLAAAKKAAEEKAQAAEAEKTAEEAKPAVEEKLTAEAKNEDDTEKTKHDAAEVKEKSTAKEETTKE
jgi:small subunit ribosomal protein S16